MTTKQTRRIFQNASAVIPYRMKRKDGTFQDLTGYVITLKVKNDAGDTHVVYTKTADVRADPTWADFNIPMNDLSMPCKRYDACAEAHNAGTGHFQPSDFWLEIAAHS